MGHGWPYELSEKKSELDHVTQKDVYGHVAPLKRICNYRLVIMGVVKVVFTTPTPDRMFSLVFVSKGLSPSPRYYAQTPHST